jgi:hypothetical protein
MAGSLRAAVSRNGRAVARSDRPRHFFYDRIGGERRACGMQRGAYVPAVNRLTAESGRREFGKGDA